jgi:hypothetical protein
VNPIETAGLGRRQRRRVGAARLDGRDPGGKRGGQAARGPVTMATACLAEINADGSLLACGWVPSQERAVLGVRPPRSERAGARRADAVRLSVHRLGNGAELGRG